MKKDKKTTHNAEICLQIDGKWLKYFAYITQTDIFLFKKKSKKPLIFSFLYRII